MIINDVEKDGKQTAIAKEAQRLVKEGSMGRRRGKMKGFFCENLAYLFGSSYCVYEESKLVNSHIKSRV